jgi:DNA-binding CsgD family transcriptional regulator
MSRMMLIIDDLYSGILDPVAWQRAIIAIADQVSGSAVLIFCVNPSTATILRDEAYRVDRIEYLKYLQHWVKKDIRIPLGMAYAVGEPVFEHRLMPVRSWTASEIHNDYLVPMDSPWLLAFTLHKAPNKVVIFSINGTRRRGAFDIGDGKRIAPFIPHLRRALEIKDRIEATQIRCEALGSNLESMSFGVIILDARAKALEVSAGAREILKDKTGICVDSDGTLLLQDPAGAEFRHWIKNGHPSAKNCDGILQIRQSNGQPIGVMITRLPEMATSWIGSEPPCWMVLIFDPDRQISSIIEILERDLGISPREAEIATHLASGYDPEKIARHLHISIHTVRSHLKAIFAKTGAASQLELVTRISRHPSTIAVRHFR